MMPFVMASGGHVPIPWVLYKLIGNHNKIQMKIEHKKHMILKVNNQTVQKKILGMKLITHPVAKIWRCRLPLD